MSHSSRRRFTEQWERVDPPAESLDSSRGALHALTQRLVNGRTLDLSLRTGPMYAFQVRRASSLVRKKDHIAHRVVLTVSRTCVVCPCSAPRRTTGARPARCTVRTNTFHGYGPSR